jgi:hypothetical protein
VHGKTELLKVLTGRRSLVDGSFELCAGVGQAVVIIVVMWRL